MSEKHIKKDPVIPGENATVDEHTLVLDGISYRLRRPTAVWLPTTEKLLRPFIDQFISSGMAYRSTFPAVFAQLHAPYNINELQAARDNLNATYASQERLVGTQRAVTGFKNLQLWNSDFAAVPAPKQEAGLLPPNDARVTGIVHIILAMADLLVQQPGYEAATIGRQFGIVPTPGSGGGGSVDIATLSPGCSARFDGNSVRLSFRSPRGISGIEMVQILCDRGDGSGKIEFVATTTHASFTDHHDLPPAGQRATYVFYTCFLDRSFQPIGQQSECDVVVSGRVTAQ